MPDSAQFYFGELPNPKYLRYLPNAGHDVSKTNYLDTAAHFYRTIVQKKALPQVTWKEKEEGTLEVTVSEAPLKIALWSSFNQEARDFRWDFTHKEWVRQEIEISSSGIYEVDLKGPEKGWGAHFVECTFENDLVFTTQIFVVPNLFQEAQAVNQ